MTFIGMIFVFIVLVFPKGILGIFNRRAEAA
jgi:ABC-type branched-subunit amino acid transport system permease subunit